MIDPITAAKAAAAADAPVLKIKLDGHMPYEKLAAIRVFYTRFTEPGEPVHIKRPGIDLRMVVAGVILAAVIIAIAPRRRNARAGRASRWSVQPSHCQGRSGSPCRITASAIVATVGDVALHEAIAWVILDRGQRLFGDIGALDTMP